MNLCPVITHVSTSTRRKLGGYIHRGGRTARLANEGIVSTIATWQDLAMIGEIEKALGGQPIPRCSVPGVEPWIESARVVRPQRRRL